MDDCIFPDDGGDGGMTAAEDILELLKKEGPLDDEKIIEKTGYVPKTVRYALRTLKSKEWITVTLNVKDSRKHIYRVV